MVQAIIGQKIDQSQQFLMDGMRIPVTRIFVPDSPVVLIKTNDKDGYPAVQIGFGTRKHSNKPQLGHVKKAQLEKAPRFLKEVEFANGETEETLQVGSLIKASDILKPGDIIDVIGVSKGKGYAGVVKRHNFRGGPRTHGQSDRERAPGSIGQTTTPGRVYKGKKMAGRMGDEQVTTKNLRVVQITDTTLTVKGLIPGSKNSIVLIKKMGEDKKFIPLYKEEEKVEEKKEVAENAS